MPVSFHTDTPLGLTMNDVAKQLQPAIDHFKKKLLIDVDLTSFREVVDRHFQCRLVPSASAVYRWKGLLDQIAVVTPLDKAGHELCVSCP